MADFLGQLRHELGNGVGAAGIDGEHSHERHGKAHANREPGAQATHLGVLLPLGISRHAAQNQHEQDHDDGLHEQLGQG